MTINQINRKPNWFKFPLNDMLLNTFMKDITRSFQSNYSEFMLGQTPYWLITDEAKLTIKSDDTLRRISVVVIVLIKRYSLRMLQMTQLFLCNNQCCLDLYQAYNTFTPRSQYSVLGYPRKQVQFHLYIQSMWANHLTH